MIAQLSDLDLIQGAWLQVDLEENGVSNPPDEYPRRSHWRLGLRPFPVEDHGTPELAGAAEPKYQQFYPLVSRLSVCWRSVSYKPALFSNTSLIPRQIIEGVNP